MPVGLCINLVLLWHKCSESSLCSGKIFGICMGKMNWYFWKYFQDRKGLSLFPLIIVSGKSGIIFYLRVKKIITEISIFHQQKLDFMAKLGLLPPSKRQGLYLTCYLWDLQSGLFKLSFQSKCVSKFETRICH